VCLASPRQAGDALFGTIDTWLLYNLTGGTVHATDVTNASRTLMMDLATLQWDDKILKDLNIPKQMLPQVPPSGVHPVPIYHCPPHMEVPYFLPPPPRLDLRLPNVLPDVLPLDPAVLRALRPSRRVLAHGPGGRAGRGRAGRPTSRPLRTR
jgi:hypothetical protein